MSLRKEKVAIIIKSLEFTIIIFKQLNNQK